MSTHKTGYVWAPGQKGWIKKQEYEAAQYDGVGPGWVLIIAFMRWYPDFLLDLMRADDADYELSFLQRMMIRAEARYQYVDIIACRGATKSTCTIWEKGVETLVWPGVRISYVGPSYKQTARIGSQVYKQLNHDYPALTRHFRLVADAKDSFEFATDFGSSFSIAAFRGNTCHQAVAEEYAQENPPAFDVEEYRQVVIPSIRASYLVNGKRSPAYIRYKQQTITSAGRRQNHSYETRCRHLQMMARGESAFVMDVPYDAVILTGMRDSQWAESMRNTLTPDEWAREMESRCTGTDQNPVVRDEVLSDSRVLMRMEEHHCCYDYDNDLKPEDVLYVIGYDVSYADGAKNAKCACVVIKCTKQTQWLKRDKYLKQVVMVDDWLPADPMKQAVRLKRLWAKFCFEGSQTYIAIDAWQYGSAVLQALMMDLGDGLAPLCTYYHDTYGELELEGAVPVIFPIKAGGAGATDPDSEMLRNAELQFENRNVQLLTQNHTAGIDAYKKYHRIKHDQNDHIIYIPYKKTNEMIGQIQNLKKVPSGAGMSEKRISRHIQRDSWSALKYALRVAQKLEKQNLVKEQKKSDWTKLFASFRKGQAGTPKTAAAPRVTERHGGRRFQ